MSNGKTTGNGISNANTYVYNTGDNYTFANTWDVVGFGAVFQKDYASGSTNVPGMGLNHYHNVTGTIPSMTTNSISTSTSGTTGNGTAFSVQNPYITVYMWKRTS